MSVSVTPTLPLLGLVWNITDNGDYHTVAMAGTTDHFLNSPAYVLGYIALKAVLAIEYGIG